MDRGQKTSFVNQNILPNSRFGDANYEWRAFIVCVVLALYVWHMFISVNLQSTSLLDGPISAK